MGILLLEIWLFAIPLCMGGFAASCVEKEKKSPAFMWISGYILMWTVFQLICVPFVLLESKFDGMFPYVVACFAAVTGFFAVLGFFATVKKGGFLCREDIAKAGAVIRSFSAKTIVLWGIAGVLILLQLGLSVCMTYGDGDDAFYVAVSTITQASDTMYEIMPYNMGTTGLDIRHGLAPFPIWIAFLSRISGLRTAMVAHVIVGTLLIGLSYVIFYKIGQILCRGRKDEALPVFMSFVALLIMFGDYSAYTAENFMIARSRQGKAALSNIVVPMTILLLLMIFEQIQNCRKAERMLWILLLATVITACLCSTLGTFLMCLLLGTAGLAAGAVYKNVRLVVNMALCCIPALVYAALYFLAG